MSPEPSQHPPAPLIRRLLLHALEPSRHGHFPLPVLLPARQFLPVFIQHDQSGQAAGPLLVFHADLAGFCAPEVRERLRPELGVRALRLGPDDVVRAVRVGGGGGFALGAESDGREPPVAFLRVCRTADDREPVHGAALVRVQPQAREPVQGLRAPFVVERAEEAVFSAVQPRGGNGQVVADQGGEFEVVVAGPEADFRDFGRGEEAVVGVAADEVGLFADREPVVADLGCC